MLLLLPPGDSRLLFSFVGDRRLLDSCCARRTTCIGTYLPKYLPIDSHTHFE